MCLRGPGVYACWCACVWPVVRRGPGRRAGLRRGRPARLMALLVAPLVFRAPDGPAAREARASLRSAPRLEARPCPPVPPAPSTPAAPGVLLVSSALRFVVRPGPGVPPAPSMSVAVGILHH